MLGGLNVLGFLYDSRKVFAWLAGLVLAGSLVWSLVYLFHFKVLDDLEKKVFAYEVELRKCKERAVKRFETQNESVFDVYRERIEEIEDEEIFVDEFNSSDYDLMYQ